MFVKVVFDMSHNVLITFVIDCNINKYHIKKFDNHDDFQLIIFNEQFCVNHID